MLFENISDHDNPKVEAYVCIEKQPPRSLINKIWNIKY